MAILMVLLALGPFLHAHYGSSRLQGFHVDGMAQLTAEHAAFDRSSFSQDTEEESAAIGVTTSHARQSFGDVDDTPMTLVALVFALFAALTSCVTRCLHGVRPVDAQCRVYAPGFPPPAHAPPTRAI